MNTRTRMISQLAAAGAACLLIAACSTTPTRSAGADNARSKLTQLQNDRQLASLAPLEINDAELAVRAAEQPQRDAALETHLVFMAGRKVDVAWALAQSRLLEDQRTALSEQREAARLESRTREADNARRDADLARNDANAARMDTEDARQQADMARSDANIARNQADDARMDTATAQQEAGSARSQADIARNQADDARMDTATAQQEAGSARNDADIARNQADAAREDTQVARQQTDELQRQIAELNAKATDRGLVVTLGDVLFETGRSDLKGGATSNLSKLADFLNQYDDRTVMIEGHTDNAGSDSANMVLSQSRADSVRTFLITQGVGSARLAASGKGEGSPVAGNDSATGRQQNRRVEVIISNKALSMR